jgi:hypothetical protein
MGEPKTKRSWTLDTAQAMLGEVRDRTETAVREVDPLLAEREAVAPNAPEKAELERKIQQRISVWVRSMEALGVEVKGLWLVDFDSGSGYYCWKWPEERLGFFHGYDEGFEGRTPIQ